tara:strand:+ start:3107 stop:3823 length:717 start_codon:yes stop_codon:yes gene_type:complete
MKSKKLIKKIKFIFTFILISFLISPKITNANKNKIKENNLYLNDLNNNLYLVDVKLLTKESILKNYISRLLMIIPVKIREQERKSLIRKDYLKLIEIYPSKKNIKKETIKKEIELLNTNINNYQNNILMLNDHLKFFNSKELLNIYKVNYKVKLYNKKYTKNKSFTWTSFCIVNSNYENEIKQIRNILTNKIYNNHDLIFRKYRFKIYRKKDIDISDSLLDKKICNYFKKFDFYDFKN